MAEKMSVPALQVLLEEGAAFEGELRFQGVARLGGRF